MLIPISAIASLFLVRVENQVENAMSHTSSGEESVSAPTTTPVIEGENEAEERQSTTDDSDYDIQNEEGANEADIQTNDFKAPTDDDFFSEEGQIPEIQERLKEAESEETEETEDMP